MKIQINVNDETLVKVASKTAGMITNVTVAYTIGTGIAFNAMRMKSYLFRTMYMITTFTAGVIASTGLGDYVTEKVDDYLITQLISKEDVES